jgi:leucyl aminopeptidase (aminopeptidase T)
VSDLDVALTTVLKDCLGIKPLEQVTVLTDPNKLSIARALVDMAREMGAEALLIEMAERETHGTEPPAAVAAALLDCEVFIAPTSKSVSHTEARRAASERGARGATMPDITEDMLGRTMSADYGAIKRRSAALAKLLTESNEVHIKSGKGTDLTLSIEGREGISDDGDLTEPGTFGNLPAGEGFIAPVEGRTNGTLVVDGSIWPVGRLDEPITFEFRDGYAVEITGKDADSFKEKLDPHGKEAFAVAELGIGTNEAAQLTGNVLEDEKILGTVHVAVGDNHSFGGVIRVSSHQDGIVLEPTVDIDGTRVLEGGQLLI